MAKTPSPSRLLVDVADEGSARSRLGRWMTRHHDEMASVVASGVNWTRTTHALVDAGLVKAGTKPSVVKRAWDRVQERVAKARAERGHEAIHARRAVVIPKSPRGDAAKKLARLDEQLRAGKTLGAEPINPRKDRDDESSK